MKQLAYLIPLALLIAAFYSCGSLRREQSVANQNVSVKDTVVVITESRPVYDTIFLQYSRTPCFGMCPVFELTVYQNGKAVYHGKNFTDRIGVYQSQWSETALQRIQFIADSIGYFGFDEKYDNDHVTDLPSIHTSILHGGQLKTVSNRYKGPRELHILYKALDKYIEESVWKPVANSSNN